MDPLIRAGLKTWHGPCDVGRTETGFPQGLVALLVALPLAFLIAADAWKRLILIGALLLVLIVELLNTAIEKLADRVSRESDGQIRRVKDMGSAAVGLALLLAGGVLLLATAR